MSAAIPQIAHYLRHTCLFEFMNVCEHRRSELWCPDLLKESLLKCGEAGFRSPSPCILHAILTGHKVARLHSHKIELLVYVNAAAHVLDEDNLHARPSRKDQLALAEHAREDATRDQHSDGMRLLHEASALIDVLQALDIQEGAKANTSMSDKAKPHCKSPVQACPLEVAQEEVEELLSLRAAVLCGRRLSCRRLGTGHWPQQLRASQARQAGGEAVGAEVRHGDDGDDAGAQRGRQRLELRPDVGHRAHVLQQQDVHPSSS
mmetsp:Transcript_96409/g.167454  ORF Transcript_96409/g.167454 Transcript_96409/m.167454 type:complete len:262 (+) Transcript_96409:785-1570(+)